MILEFQGKSLNLSKPVVMGVVNLTPDSFFDGGQHNTTSLVLQKVEQHLKEGASIIDIGAFSSRPGADMVTEAEERNRLLTPLKAIVSAFPAVKISVDTYRSKVAKAAVDAGAFMINDISGGNLDHDMFDYIGAHNVPYVLMHMRGTPATMQSLTNYTNLVQDIKQELQAKLLTLEQKGARQLVIDPGFGFAKTLDQNYELLKGLQQFQELNVPVLVGVSRKSMIHKKLGTSAKEALNGTTVLNTIALSLGCKILRVHDVKEAQEILTLTQNIYR